LFDIIAIICDTIIMMIKLTGITNHGKNRVREHGDLWEVLELPTGVIKMSHKPIHPPIKSVKTGEERWLDDTNFSWIFNEINGL
jgi:hypothetical protein